MRDLSSLQFSSVEEEIAELFWDIGLRKNAARVLALMLWNINLSARDIERICDLRQSEVSVALTDLIKKKWIKVTKLIIEKKGRPIKIYRRTRSPDKILDELRGMIKGDYDIKSEEIEKVREIIKGCINK